MKRLLITTTLIISCSLACFSQKGKWKKAQKENSIESYQNFIHEFPESNYVEEAKKRRLKLEIAEQESQMKSEYSEASYYGTESGWQKFIDKYPDHNFYTRLAKENLEFLRNMEEAFDNVKNRHIDKIKSYKLGELTDEEFFNDGWTKPHGGSLGTLFVNQTDASDGTKELIIILGYDLSPESISFPDPDALRMWEPGHKNIVKHILDGENASEIYNGGKNEEYCTLVFKNGVLYDVQWLQDVNLQQKVD